jgi:hypothetical protein
LADVNAGGRLLLGTVGWERADWLSDYYPPDLPADWRLAYYANDCGCLLLPADSWSAMDRDLLAESIDEAAGRLLFFLEAPIRRPPDSHARLSLFATCPAILLVQRPDPGHTLLPQWVGQGSGLWVDTDSDAALVRWSLDGVNLRELRARADQLPASTQALVIDGPAASPASVPELKTLLELMGKA